MRRRTFNKLFGASVVTAALGRVGLGHAADLFRAGFVYVGPVADFGWSHQHDLGRQAAQKALGDKITTRYVESVKEGPDAERVIRQLATGGCGIIFTTSFGFMNATLKGASTFPKVKFENATGYKRAANVATYNIRFYEGRYVQGIIAGKVSKSGVVGYIGPVPIPEVVMGMNAFIQGMRTINPQGRIKIVWINSWYDPGKESDAAKALIDQGADIIAQHTDSAAPLQVAEQRGVHGFGQSSDMIKFAPKAQLTSSVDDWDEYYTQRIQAAMDGSWKTQDVWGGLAAGMLLMAPFTNMPDDVAQAAQTAVDGIKSGKIVIFKGPINDQDGKVKVADGTKLSDEEILGMNWLAEGIQGKLPR